MDAEDPHEGAMSSASRPLLKEDSVTTAPLESNASLLSSAAEAGGLEQQDTNTSSNGRRQIPTLVFIMVPLVVFLVGTFLAAAFMPASAVPPDESTPSNSSASGGGNSTGEEPPGMILEKAHDDPVAPSLLFVRDQTGLLNVRENTLYRQLKEATFYNKDEVTLTGRRQSSMHSDKDAIGYGEPLELAWNHAAAEEDIVAMYCPAGETDPKKFRDAATIAQVVTSCSAF